MALEGLHGPILGGSIAPRAGCHILSPVGFFSRRPGLYPVDLARLQSIRRSRGFDISTSDFYWDGLDRSVMNTGRLGNSTIPNIGERADWWPDKSSGVVLHAAASEDRGPFVATNGLVFSGTPAELDELTQSGSFDALHNGTGGSIWYRIKFLSDGDGGVLFDTCNISSANIGFGMWRRTTSNVIEAFVAKDGTSDTVQSAEVLASDDFVDIVVSVESDIIKMWVDGVLTTSPLSGPSTSAASFRASVGRRVASNDLQLHAIIETIAIRNQPATEGEVLNWLGQRTEPDPVTSPWLALFDAADLNGTQWPDVTGTQALYAVENVIPAVGSNGLVWENDAVYGNDGLLVPFNAGDTMRWVGFHNGSAPNDSRCLMEWASQANGSGPETNVRLNIRSSAALTYNINGQDASGSALSAGGFISATEGLNPGGLNIIDIFVGSDEVKLRINGVETTAAYGGAGTPPIYMNRDTGVAPDGSGRLIFGSTFSGNPPSSGAYVAEHPVDSTTLQSGYFRGEIPLEDHRATAEALGTYTS